MDIHRCRFVPYPASATNALAFSHTSTNANGPTPSTLRLALGRANGDIEIWDPRDGLWVQETVIKGGKDRSIEGLAWTHDLEGEDEKGQITPGKLRLFSIGYSTVVTEWDLAKGVPLQHSSGNYGEIWCMAAQPRWQAHKEQSLAQKQGPKTDQLLAIGCGDGTLILHSTTDGELKYERTLPRPSGKKARALSLAFQGRQRVIAGFSDSMIRIFDVAGRGQVINLSLGAGPKNGPQSVLVWAVKCLHDGTIISGDSTGEIKIWDANTSTILQRIQSHNADVLDVTPSVDGMSFLSGGMDRRTVLYRRRMDGKTKGRWAEIMHTRLHSSDVKVMANFEAKGLNVVASGGLDTTPIIIPQQRLGKEHTRALPTLPNSPPLSSAPSKRLIISWWDREVRIWRLGPLDDTDFAAENLSNSLDARRLVARIAVQGEESITSTSIMHNGGLVAIATVSSVKVFRLKSRKASNGLKVQKIETLETLSRGGARLLNFSPDSRWLLVIRPDSKVEIFRVKQDGEEAEGFSILEPAVRLRRRLRHLPKSKAVDGTHGDYLRCVSRITWSSDSRMFVTCDLAGFLDTWKLLGNENLMQEDTSEVASEGDSSSSVDTEDESDGELKPRLILGQRWVRMSAQLPSLPSSPVVLSFRPAMAPFMSLMANGSPGSHAERHNTHTNSHDILAGEDRLLAVTTRHEVLEYSVTSGHLTDWSRRNPSSCLPSEFRETRERAMGCVWDVSSLKERLWLYGSTWLWMFDVSRDMVMDQQDAMTINGTEGELSLAKKRKRGAKDTNRKERMKHSSGAGNAVTLSERSDGLGQGITTVDNGTRKWISFDEDQGLDGDDMEVDYVEGSGGDRDSMDLTRMRRTMLLEDAGQAKSVTAGGADMTAIDRSNRDNAGPLYWRTFKYRPIMGIVPIGPGSGEDVAPMGGISKEHANIEVALVERPSWDLDLAPRWEGDQEWNNLE